MELVVYIRQKIKDTANNCIFFVNIKKPRTENPVKYDKTRGVEYGTKHQLLSHNSTQINLN